MDEIKHELENRLERLRLVGKLLQAHRFNARPCFDLEMMQEMGFLC